MYFMIASFDGHMGDFIIFGRRPLLYHSTRGRALKHGNCIRFCFLLPKLVVSPVSKNSSGCLVGALSYTYEPHQDAPWYFKEFFLRLFFGNSLRNYLKGPPEDSSFLVANEAVVCLYQLVAGNHLDAVRRVVNSRRPV
jgi:hypothetical protein